MKKQDKKKRDKTVYMNIRVVFLFVVSSLLTGCFPANPPVTSPKQEIDMSQTNTSTFEPTISTAIPVTKSPTITQTKFNTPTNTNTPVPIPSVTLTLTSSPTQTSTTEITQTHTPTFGPSPTFTSTSWNYEYAVKMIGGLFDTNGNCRLPCWWGIIPGKTTVSEIQHTFTPYVRAGVMNIREQGSNSIEMAFKAPNDSIDYL